MNGRFNFVTVLIAFTAGAELERLLHGERDWPLIFFFAAGTTMLAIIMGISYFSTPPFKKRLPGAGVEETKQVATAAIAQAMYRQLALFPEAVTPKNLINEGACEFLAGCALAAIKNAGLQVTKPTAGS